MIPTLAIVFSLANTPGAQQKISYQSVDDRYTHVLIYMVFKKIRWICYRSPFSWSFIDEVSKPICQGSYRHRECCYHCQAVANFDENLVDQTHLLYTNWGRDADYRSECLSASAMALSEFATLESHHPWKQYFVCFLCLCMARLTSTSEFVRINGSTPLTRIRGFSPWRV